MSMFAILLFLEKSVDKSSKEIYDFFCNQGKQGLRTDLKELKRSGAIIDVGKISRYPRYVITRFGKEEILRMYSDGRHAKKIFGHTVLKMINHDYLFECINCPDTSNNIEDAAFHHFNLYVEKFF